MFREISLKEVQSNLVQDIADEWMLVTAGTADGYNMMTASWGFAGEMWGSDTVIAMVRPQRYTMEFIDKQDYFTLSFYGENKAVHKVCGSTSGRDTDKTALTGLTPVFDGGTTYFQQARMVFICKKQYVQQMDEKCFVDHRLTARWYPDNDYHIMVFGKVERVLISKEI